MPVNRVISDLNSLPNPGTSASTEGADKLCMDAIAQAWSKQSGNSPAAFEEQIREQLHMLSASHIELNKAYMNAIRSEEIRKHGTTVGEKIVEDGEEKLQCQE